MGAGLRTVIGLAAVNPSLEAAGKTSLFCTPRSMAVQDPSGRQRIAGV